MNYMSLLTNVGSAKIASATAIGQTLALSHIAVGDGAGAVTIPNATATTLVNEVYRAQLNDLRVDEDNSNWVVAELYIPGSVGNFWIREIGVFDTDGDLIAIANYPETMKPITEDGVQKDVYINVIFEVSSASAVTMQVNPSFVMASQEFVLNKLKEYVTKVDFNEALLSLVPAGLIFPWFDEIVPDGYLAIDGSTGLSRANYARMYNKNPNFFGQGNGTTTFDMPDWRGRFLGGYTSVYDIGSIQEDAIRNIVGTIDVSWTGDHAMIGDLTGAFVSISSGTKGDAPQYALGGNATKRAQFNASRVVPTAEENRPKAARVNWIIKY